MAFVFSQKVIVPNLFKLEVINPGTQLAQVAPACGSTVFMDFNSGSDTSLPGWTYWASGADDYGSPGWRKDSGRFVSGNTNWMPRIMSYNSYGQDVIGTIDTANRAPSTATGGSLRVYDTGKSSIQ